MPLKASLSASDALYNELTVLLNPSSPTVLELSILPADFSSSAIEYDADATSPALAISKSALVSCFLRACRILSRANVAVGNAETPLSASTNESEKTLKSRSEREDNENVLYATSIILLLEPNHLTAANWRKRRLIDTRTKAPEDVLEHVLRAEWAFVTSILTSPLPPRHAKSSTLWHHRFWLLQTFTPASVGLCSFSLRQDASSSLQNSVTEEVNEIEQHWLQQELKVIMQAAERHPRNYYAWQYARELINWIISSPLQDRDRDVQIHHDSIDLPDAHDPPSHAAQAKIGVLFLHMTHESQQAFYGQMTFQVHQWCLLHPRDISGWAFLTFILNAEPPVFSPNSNRASEQPVRPRLVDNNTAQNVYFNTLSFAQKFNWQGESVEWFLGQLGHCLGKQPPSREKPLWESSEGHYQEGFFPSQPT